ncbi:MAG: response regulator [Thermodesulfobacteriota bacterium]|nr:response regulator [Thermodesulfobacteriota bacterium]
MTEGYRSPETWAGNISASAILHSLPDAVLVTDLQARITYFNRAAEKITGFRGHEAQGMYCKDVLKSGLCETECAVKRALDSDQNIFNIETTITTATGETIPALVSASLIKDSAGKLVGYLYAFRDISPFKKIMSDLEVSRAKLAERNAELDMAIEELKMTQGQLLQAQKMESLGTLAGGIAHDFNNILTGILGFASLIRTKLPADSPIARYVMQIERSAVRAAELTSMILTFARRGRFEIKTADLNEIVLEVLQILGRTTDRSIKIGHILSPKPCYVDIDSAKMEQVVMNICVNAVEAMPNGGKLTIKTEVSFYSFDGMEKKLPHQPTDGKYVRLSVVDTGGGMDGETRQRIFDPFFTTKGESGGTGLGLAMVYGVINEFNGYIEVESTPGAGTAFSVFLPISKSPSEAEKIEEQEKAPDVPKGKGETILLVDDESIIRELGKDALEQLGYNVFVAEDGLAAIDLYEKHRDKIDLVILDLIMPNLGGKETFERLRQINPDIKVVISTGYAKDGVLEPLLDKKANGFIKKPYKIQNMARVVRSAIGSTY